MFPNRPQLRLPAPKTGWRAMLLILVLSWSSAVLGQVQFPGPAEIYLPGGALSSVPLPLAVGQPDYLVSGRGDGTLSLHRYSISTERFGQLTQFILGGDVVDLIPWEGRPLLDQGVVAATTNPDRVVFLRVGSVPPYFTVEAVVGLEEDPGELAFVGELVGGVAELAVSLPGIDKVAFLREEAGVWASVSRQDTGDRPLSILGIDLDGDQIRELVVGNEGSLSGTLGTYRRDAGGEYIGTIQDFPAGFPSDLAAYDFGKDGIFEVAASVQGLPEVVLMQAEAGGLVAYRTVDLTVPADGVHLADLFDGSPGLFTSSSTRGLVEFFQLQDDTWLRRNSYYPGCYPLAILSGEFNGDAGLDLISVGGSTNKITVMFANPEPGFWGYPALALNGSPGASDLADFDGDGLTDLVVATGDQPLLGFFPGLPGGGFNINPVDVPLTFYPGQVTVLETDGDPLPELAVLDRSFGRVVVMDFVPGTGFTIVSDAPSGNAPFFAAADDLDADGIDDLMIINREVQEIRILFGAGDNTFPTYLDMGLSNGADWISALDLNADGLLDLAFSDGVNRIWTTLNEGGRAFGSMSWLNAGSGAGIMALGDLDQDQDQDLIVVNKSDESLTMFENTGEGVLSRRIGAHALLSAPVGILVRDLNLDGLPELVMNLREDGLLGVSFPLSAWDYSQTSTFSGGPDVAIFKVDDINNDEIPDLLTLDNSLKLGLTLLNIEQKWVSVEPTALAVECDHTQLVIRVKPDRLGSWQIDFGSDGRWETLAVTGQAVLGEMDYDRGTWILSVDRTALGRTDGDQVVRLTIGEYGDRETLDLRLENSCPAGTEEDLPRVAWAREPWPNPFNPLVNARFVLGEAVRVEVGIYDLAGRRVALLADGWFEAGDHAVRWDGRRNGQTVGAGVYLMRISTPQKTLLHKVMLLK